MCSTLRTRLAKSRHQQWPSSTPAARRFGGVIPGLVGPKVRGTRGARCTVPCDRTGGRVLVDMVGIIRWPTRQLCRGAWRGVYVGFRKRERQSAVQGTADSFGSHWAAWRIVRIRDVGAHVRSQYRSIGIRAGRRRPSLGRHPRQTKRPAAQTQRRFDIVRCHIGLPACLGVRSGRASEGSPAVGVAATLPSSAYRTPRQSARIARATLEHV